MSRLGRRKTYQPTTLKTATMAVFMVATAPFFLLPPDCAAATTASRDAYARIDDQAGTLVIGTGSIEEKIQLAHGDYLLHSLQNSVTHQEYIHEGTSSEEFRATVNGTTTSGATGEWSWVNGSAKIQGQGEIEAIIHLRGKLLEVEKHYVIYPDTSIIRQWVVFKNRSGGPVTLSNPYMLAQRIATSATTPQTLSYMTGGGSFSGSQVLKQVAFPDSYARSFDTKDKAEVQSVEGIQFEMSMAYASGRYMPWFCISDAASKGGLFVGLDYYGHWVAEVGNFQGAPGYLGLRLAGYEKKLQPGETIETPKSLTGVYTGDLDAMGNQLKDWQYRYLWDYTNDDYFSKIRYAAEMRWQPSKGFSWGGGTVDNWDYRLQAMFHTADLIHYVGADILWQDAGWHDYLGDNDGPDFMQVNEYLKKSGMRLAVWWPLWYAEKKSQILQKHPDWGEGGVFRGPLDPSRPEVLDWMSNQLNQKAAAWGDFQWREDGSAVEPVANNETPMLSQYQNIMEMQKQFRKQHPGSSIDLCAGGGNLMSFEGLRMADVGQLTDGGSLVFGSYYSSYLFPPDKLDDWTRTQNATWTNVATTLTMAPAWMGEHGLYGHEQGIALDDGKENLRKTFEIYHYLVRQGVAGRWVQIYHPRIEGDEPIYYLERLSRDKHRGAIVLKHFPSGQIRIYPKGLNPAEVYDVRFRDARTTSKRTGQDLASNGITLINPQPGELIYLGLPNHPGSGTDSVPPTAPAQVTKNLGANLGVTGVELHWAASTDNNWISYYQIYRDGEPIDRIATGLFYFDHTDQAALGSTYEVQAVDGDGNASAKVTGQQAGSTGSVIYTALGGFLAGKDYSYQGAHGWQYEEWEGGKQRPVTWNGALGQMGLYEGTASEHQVLIGGSWMRPGDRADAVRIFTVPASGQVTLSGDVHKDVYHTAGDGVRIKVLKGDQQVWPSEGWETIAAADTKGKEVEKTLTVQAGDKLYFIVNHNGDAADDETVWNPKVTYQTAGEVLRPEPRQSMDDLNNNVEYSGTGWQRRGTPPWAKGAGLGEDIGYLQNRYAGTLSVSGTAGDKMTLKFRGTGVRLIGDTGSDRGVAAIKIDGSDMGTIDTFVPENYPNFTVASSSSVREPNNIALTPPTVLWGTSGLRDGEHVIEVTVSGRKNEESTGTYIGIDEIVITGNTNSAAMQR
jgi:hypothetical protein